MQNEAINPILINSELKVNEKRYDVKTGILSVLIYWEAQLPQQSHRITIAQGPDLTRLISEFQIPPGNCLPQYVTAISDFRGELFISN